MKELEIVILNMKESKTTNKGLKYNIAFINFSDQFIKDLLNEIYDTIEEMKYSEVKILVTPINFEFNIEELILLNEEKIFVNPMKEVEVY